MKVKSCDYYDSYPSDNGFPQQLWVDVLGGKGSIDVDSIRVRSKGDDGTTLSSFIKVPDVFECFSISLPCRESWSFADVSIESLVGEDVIDTFKTRLRIIAHDQLALDVPTMGDSFHIRSMIDSRLVSISDLIDKIELKKYDGIDLPETSVANTYLEAIINLLREYRTKDTEIQEGILQIGSLLDLSEDLEVTKEVLSLAFYYISVRYGLNPIVVMKDGRYFVGLEVATIDFDNAEVSKYTFKTIVRTESRPFVTHIGRYLMAELDEESDHLQSMRLAHDSLSKNLGKNYCIYSIEQQRIEEMENYLSEEKV